MDDAWARWLHRSQIALIVLICFSAFIITFNSLNGVPMGQTGLGFWLNASVHIFVAYIAFRSRHALVVMMRGRDRDFTRFDEIIAQAYPWFCIAAALVTWLIVSIVVSFENFALLQRNPHYITMFLLIMAPALDTSVRGAGGSRLSSVLQLVLLTARIVIVVIFALLALGNISIDTTPLLAGAGIAGLAIGFGAQKLVTDVGMVIRGKFTAKSGTQLMIRKEIFNRASAAFAENGIDFARREVRVALPDKLQHEELTEEDQAAIAAAASQASEQAGTPAGGSSDDRINHLSPKQGDPASTVSPNKKGLRTYVGGLLRRKLEGSIRL